MKQIIPISNINNSDRRDLGRWQQDFLVHHSTNYKLTQEYQKGKQVSVFALNQILEQVFRDVCSNPSSSDCNTNNNVEHRVELFNGERQTVGRFTKHSTRKENFEPDLSAYNMYYDYKQQLSGTR